MALAAAVWLAGCTRSGPVPAGPTPQRTPLAATGRGDDLPTGRSLARRGQAAYRVLCVECHGADGRGDGPAAKLLDPPPRDFRDPVYGRQQRPDWYRHAIAHGVTGTAMPGWDDRLDADTTWDTAFYVWSWSIPVAQSARGRDLYGQRCQSCHGVAGRSEPTARLDAPARVRLSLDAAAAQLTQVHGDLTADLTPADRTALAAHMATFLFEALPAANP
jgi:mono/diheme cytochrome c family protein